MGQISDYSKYFPYLYFITVVGFWFTDVNRTEGIAAYPILLLGIPFIWQLIKPNRQLNSILGIISVCLSSYMIIGFLFDILNIVPLSQTIKKFLFYGGIFGIINFAMAVWMLRNSIHRRF